MMATPEQLYDPAVAEERIRMLHESNLHVSIAATGAGLGIQGKLWAVAGASATLIEAVNPYNQASFDSFVGRDWSGEGYSYSSELGAVALSQGAFFSAQEHGANGKLSNLDVAGLGLSAAVSTDRDRRGDNKIHTAIRSNKGVDTAVVYTSKDLGRETDGNIADLIGINMILAATEIEPIPIQAGSGVHSDQLVETSQGLVLRPESLDSLDLPPDFETMLIDIDGNRLELALDPKKHIVMPGSFNPVQFGHDRIAQAVRRQTGKQPVLEITASNIEKAGIGPAEIAERATRLRGRWPVILTRENARFVDKAAVYGCDFIVGYDTAQRIVDPTYYNGPGLRRRALDSFKTGNIRFYVAGRRDEQQVLRTAADIRVEEEYRDLFLELAGDFNISSTMIRGLNGR